MSENRKNVGEYGGSRVPDSEERQSVRSVLEIRPLIDWVKKNYAWRPGEDDEYVGQLIDALEKAIESRDWHALQEKGLRDDIGNLEAELASELATHADTLNQWAKAIKERDEARRWAETMQAQKFEWENREADVRKERDEALAVIAEALDWRDEAYHGAFGKDEFAQGYGYARRAIGRILRAALDKEGNDDE